MNRLTTEGMDFEEMFCEECTFYGEPNGCNLPGYKSTCKPFAFFVDAAEKLKKYEDTGLTPEETDKLAKAQEEGRLVELPCMVDSVVYALIKCESVVMWHDNRINRTGATECPFENQCDIEECDDNNLIIVKTTVESITIEARGASIYLSDKNGEFHAADFGKTVFLTRAEAEAALKEQEANNGD